MCLYNMTVQTVIMADLPYDPNTCIYITLSATSLFGKRQWRNGLYSRSDFSQSSCSPFENMKGATNLKMTAEYFNKLYGDVSKARTLKSCLNESKIEQIMIRKDVVDVTS